MATNTIDLQTGMVVCDRHGTELGCVGEVWPFVPESYAEGPPVPDRTPSPREGTGYFRIDVDRGHLLDLTHDRLYVPFREIRRVTPGERVELRCTKGQCEARYDETPWFVHRDAG